MRTSDPYMQTDWGAQLLVTAHMLASRLAQLMAKGLASLRAQLSAYIRAAWGAQLCVKGRAHLPWLEHSHP